MNCISEFVVESINGQCPAIARHNNSMFQLFVFANDQTNLIHLLFHSFVHSSLLIHLIIGLHFVIAILYDKCHFDFAECYLINGNEITAYPIKYQCYTILATLLCKRKKREKEKKR